VGLEERQVGAAGERSRNSYLFSERCSGFTEALRGGSWTVDLVCKIERGRRAVLLSSETNRLGEKERKRGEGRADARGNITPRGGGSAPCLL